MRKSTRTLAIFMVNTPVYGIVAALPAFTFAFVNAPVGRGKIGAVAVLYFPVVLLTMGWINGKKLFYLHAAAVVMIAFSACMLWFTYNPETAILSREKTWALGVESVAILSYMTCALASGIRNARLHWQGRSLVLRVPIYGEISIIGPRPA